MKKKFATIISKEEYFSYAMIPEATGINIPSKGINKSLNCISLTIAAPVEVKLRIYCVQSFSMSHTTIFLFKSICSLC